MRPRLKELNHLKKAFRKYDSGRLFLYYYMYITLFQSHQHLSALLCIVGIMTTFEKYLPFGWLKTFYHSSVDQIGFVYPEQKGCITFFCPVLHRLGGKQRFTGYYMDG